MTDHDHDHDHDYYNTNPDGSRCTSWIQDSTTGKLIPRSRYTPKASNTPAILKPLEPFKSPIDGQEISCRSHLRAHNLAHGVTNAHDYSPEYTKARNTQKQMAQNRQDKVERLDTIKRAMHRYGHGD